MCTYNSIDTQSTHISSHISMSPAARWILGIAAIFFAVIFVPPAFEIPALWGFVVFLLLIAVSCFSQRARPIAVRIIGASVFILFVWYVIDEIGKPSMPRAILALLVWGVPGGYVAVTGKYPFWGMGAAAFKGPQTKKK